MSVAIRVYVQMTLKKNDADRLMAMMQNELYEDESSDEHKHRTDLFERIKQGHVDPGGRVREGTVTFSMFEGNAQWLESLVNNPIYDDESVEEQDFRALIREEFWCPDISALQRAIHTWDDIPF